MSIHQSIEETILRLSGSKNPHAAALARLLSTDIVQKTHEWVNDEGARGLTEGALTHALVNLTGLLLFIPMSWAIPGHELRAAKILIEAMTIEINNLAKEKIEFERRVPR